MFTKLWSTKTETYEMPALPETEGGKTFFDKLKDTYVLLQHVNCSKTVRVAELAEELDMHKTDLMNYILNFKKLFVLNVPKNGTGLEISHVYNTPEENPAAEEWLAKKVKDNEHNVWACPIREFNSIAGWTIVPSEDNPDSAPECRGKSLWKNSKEKVEKALALGFLHKQQFYFGPFNERTPRILDNVFLDSEKQEVIEKFKKAGWNLILEQV